jgi:hypothetical protein
MDLSSRELEELSLRFLDVVSLDDLFGLQSSSGKFKLYHGLKMVGLRKKINQRHTRNSKSPLE